MPRKRQLPAGMWEREGVFYARFRADGREVRKRLSTDFEAARQLLNDLRARADRADFGIVDNDYSWATLKAEFLKWARQAMRRPHEAEAHLRRFEQFTTVRSVRQIDEQFIIAYRDWRLALPSKRAAKAVCPRTVNIEIGTVQSMLNKAVKWNRIGSNPIAGIKPLRNSEPRKQRRSLSVDEVRRLLVASPDHLRPVWRMFMCTGIRRNELAQLRFADVDFDRQTVTVRATVAKSGKAREIPLDNEMLALLKGLKAAAKQRQPMPGKTPTETERQAANFTRDHVFVTKANTPLGGNLLIRFYASCKRAGIDDAGPGSAVDIHSLRVSFTTLSLEYGANPKAVQAILGHSTLAMTMNVYAKATERSKREAITALPFATADAPDYVLTVQNAHTVRTSNNPELQSPAVKLLA